MQEGAEEAAEQIDSGDSISSEVILPQSSARRRGSLLRLPFVLFFCSIVVMNFFLFFAMANLTISGISLVFTLGFPALVAAEIAVFSLICGLIGRGWTVGFALASLLSSVAALALLGSFIVPWSSSFVSSEDLSFLSFAALLPAFVLLGSLPLILVRLVRGWRLTPEPASEQVERVGMEDFFVLTAMVAASLYLVRVPEVVLEIKQSQMWGGLLFAAFLLPMIGAATLIPYVWARFRVSSPALRFVCQFFAIGLPIAIFQLVYMMSLSFSGGVAIPAWNYILPGVFGGIVFAGIFIWGVAAIGWSGFQLVSNRTLGNVGVIDSGAEQKRVWINRRVAGGLVLSVLAINSILMLVESSRQERDWELVRYGTDLAQRGGRLEVSEREIIKLFLGPKTTDEDIRDLDSLPSLKVLSCADSEITDSALVMIREKFPNLEELDLAGTNITPDCADQLSQMPTLRKLSLARTQVDMQAIIKIAETSQFWMKELDIGGLQLTEDELVTIAESLTQFTSLGLSGYGFNDRQLQPILDALSSNLFQNDSLDLSGNPIDGSCLANLKSLQVTKLVLNDTRVTDANLKKVLAAGFVKWLIVGDTEVTDALLPSITRSSVEVLEIGDGKVTEAGIKKHLSFYSSELGLHGKQFTGEELFDGNLSVNYLDLSSSGIRDEALAAMADTTIFSLDLSNTEITDAGVTELAKTQFLSWVNLSGTKVTAAGLAKGELGRLQHVVVSSDQFTLDEIKAISKVINLRVDGPSSISPYPY